MAAEIKTRPPQRQPILLNRIEDETLDTVTMAAFTPGEDGIITVGEDNKAMDQCLSDAELIVEHGHNLSAGGCADAGVSQAMIRRRFEHLMSCFHLADDVSLEEGDKMAKVRPFCNLINERSIRIWLKRETGQYWPSVCHFLTSSCSTLFYAPNVQRIFVGQDSGEIEEFEVSPDYNRITLQRKYLAHQRQVTGCAFSQDTEVLIACGRDKYITWHGTKNGQRFAGYQTNSVPLCLQYDAESHYVFAGLNNGEITVLKINKSDSQLITSLKGHSGAVTCLCWDAPKEILYSGSVDKAVILWDIGSKKGTAIELQGHTGKLVSLHYLPDSRQLISISYNGSLVVWNMEIKRNETPLWQDSNQCTKCQQPFFWNFRQMWNDKTIGLRQHHCRKCGIAVCASCSSDRTTIPLYGFEFEVRVCAECFHSISEQDRAPTATFHELKSAVTSSAIDIRRRWLVTSSSDRTIKLWDVKEIIGN